MLGIYSDNLLKQYDLIWHLYSIYQKYCSVDPSSNKDLIKETGNYRESLCYVPVQRCLPCFNFIYSLFYLEDK